MIKYFFTLFFVYALFFKSFAFIKPEFTSDFSVFNINTCVTDKFLNISENFNSFGSSGAAEILSCRSVMSFPDILVFVTPGWIKITMSEWSDHDFNRKQFYFEISPNASVKLNGNDMGSQRSFFINSLNEFNQLEVIGENGTSQRYMVSIVLNPPNISSINCDSLKSHDTLVVGRELLNNVPANIKYEGGNGNYFIQREVYSTGVLGLKATLIPGVLATGSGVLSYQISGKPQSVGVANFPIDFIGKTCTFSLNVKENTAKSNQKTMLTFEFINKPWATGEIKDSTINITVPYGTDLMSIVSAFTISNYATVKIDTVTQISAQTANNFTNPVKYTVIAEDGSQQSYTVYVTVAPKKSSANELISFKFVSPNVTGVISGTDVNIVVPKGTNLQALVAEFTISEKATAKVWVGFQCIVQNSGQTANDYTKPLDFLVLAEDGIARTYSIKVTVDTNLILKSSACELTSFKFNFISPAVTGVITGTQIKLTVPAGTNVQSLVASFRVSDKAIVKVNGIKQVSSTSANDFTNSIVYMVIAEDGTFKNYFVTVVIGKSSEKDIISFNIIDPPITGKIFNSSILLNAPAGANLKNVIANFTLSPYASVSVSNVKQISGVTINDLSNAKQYDVQAEDSSVKSYSVYIKYEPAIISGEKTICVNSTSKLTANVPGVADLNKKVWVLTDTTIAKITREGIVTGIKTGKCIVEFYDINNVKSFDTLYVVTSKIVNSASITGNFETCLGNTHTLSSSVPGGVWTSSDTSIVKIGLTNGNYTALKVGVVPITYIFSSNSQCEIIQSTVKLMISEPIKDLKIVGDSLVNVGVDYQFTSNYKGIWYIDSSKIATIDAYGYLTPLKTGVVQVTFTVPNYGCPAVVTKDVRVQSKVDSCATFKGFVNSVEPTDINSSSCNGSVSIRVEGGTLPYSYAWSNGVTTSSITEICQGEYTVTVTDATKCSLTLSTKVIVDSTKNACTGFYTKVISSKDDANVNGQCSGTIHTKVFGGKLPYSIKWNNGSTDSVLMNLCAGTYTMNVSDANNCTFWVITDIKSTQVVDPCKDFYAVITDLKDDQANSGSCTGSMIATAKGGKLPYSYQWNIGDTTSSLQNQCAGEYQVTIHDGNQCSVVVSTSIVKIGQQQTNLSLEIITKDASSIQACDGSMYVKILNGTAPYTYSHSNAATTFDRTGICSGVYTVTVKDAKGLENTATYVISNPINTITTIVKALKDSISLDTLKTQVKNNCSINYNAIDSVSIKEAEFVSLDTVLVTWAVYANNTTTYVSQKYGLSKGSGVYALALTMYCKELKDIGNYFTATQQYYFKEKSATTSIEEVNDQVQLKVYPNPFTDKVHVKLDRVGDYKLMVFDVTGKVLTEKSYMNTNHMNLNLEQLAAGEYLLKVINDEFVQTRMITK